MIPPESVWIDFVRINRTAPIGIPHSLGVNIDEVNNQRINHCEIGTSHPGMVCHSSNKRMSYPESPELSTDLIYELNSFRWRPSLNGIEA